jgi:hypothetical protein
MSTRSVPIFVLGNGVFAPRRRISNISPRRSPNRRSPNRRSPNRRPAPRRNNDLVRRRRQIAAIIRRHLR